VFATVLREGLVLVLVGVITGCGGTLGLTGYLRTMLYAVSATDPVTFLAVTLALLTTAMIAACIRARRAASIDPMVALRHY
jgi:putative ABC transport system permease protein